MDDCMIDGRTAVYRYYDRFGTLLYVGITGRGHRRFAEHVRTKDWWPYVASQEVEHYPTRSDAEDRERYLVEALTPPFNTAMNPLKRSRESYLVGIADADVGEPTFGAHLVRFGSKLEVAVVDRDGQSVSFATRPRDWPVIESTSVGGLARVFVGDNVAGNITGINSVGAVGILSAVIRKGIDDLRPTAILRLKVDLKHKRATVGHVRAQVALK